MQEVSSLWGPALATAHGLTATISVLYKGVKIADDVPISSGTVRVDGASDIRRQLSFTIADPADFPRDFLDTWGVYGQRITAEAGIAYSDGKTETVMLGEFITTQVSGDIHQGPLTVEAQSKELLLKRAIMSTAVTTAAREGNKSTSVYGFISMLVNSYAPGETVIDHSSYSGDPIASKTYDAGTEVLQAITEAADTIGADFFANAHGTFELRDIPDPDTVQPVWTIAAGEDGVLSQAEMTLTADDIFNRIVVFGENAEEGVPPITAVWELQNPNPLSVDGPMGAVPKMYQSSLITTFPKALSTAKALLQKYRTPNRTVKLTAIHNHALDAGDCIAVDYGKAAKPELHIIKTIEHPLTFDDPTTTIETVGGRDDDSMEPQ